MPSPRLGPQRNEAIKEVIRALIAERYGGNASALAKDAHVTSSLISETLSGNRNVGMKLLDGLVAVTGVSADDLATRGAAALKGPSEERSAEHARPIYRDRPEWTAVAGEVLRRYPRLRARPQAVEAAGDTSGLYLDGPLSVEAVADAAEYWLKHASVETLERVATEPVDESIARAEALEREAERLYRVAIERGETPRPLHEIHRELLLKERRAKRGTKR